MSIWTDWESCIMRGLQYSVREGVIVFTSTRMDTMKERVGGMHDDGWMDWWTDGMGWDDEV